ncbi:MAG: hypothetical protein LBJ62_05780 [Bifidobacteriaceae bacterium]|jgi:hypothetical protein|nr:hypothetical protein [Bifidobacteriaceae bacterium]
MVTRIKGAALYLHIGPNTDLEAEVTSAILAHEDADSDLLTFADAKKGGLSQPSITVGYIQSTDAAAFWSWVWDNPGTVAAFSYAPHGNSQPSAAQPHFIGYLKVPTNKPSLGGEAIIDGPGYTAETQFLVCHADGQLPGEVTRDNGSSD